MSFRYFVKSHAFSTYTTKESECDFCNRIGPGYGGPFYGLEDIEFICEECLVAGRLREVDSFTNEGDFIALREQLKVLFPEYSESQIMELERQRTDELEHRTPEILTNQDYTWPAHCGDYCCFIKEVGLADLDRLAPDGDGRKFFMEHFHKPEGLEDYIDNWWPGIRPDSPEDNSVTYCMGVYLFQCLHCGEFVILWDAC